MAGMAGESPEDIRLWLDDLSRTGIDDAAFGKLLELAQSGNREIRRMAYLWLGRSGRKEAVPVLMKALNERFWHFRAAAVTALADLGAREALERIQDLAENDPAYGVRQDAQRALQRLREED
ncbi:MAG: HEAT repeat domain-containing protein [Bacillota bacterium]